MSIKKQVGLTVGHQKRPTYVNSDADISTSSQIKDSKSAQKRKSEPSSKVKTPLLHNLLAGSSYEDDSVQKMAPIFWQNYTSEDACKEFAKSRHSESISSKINMKHITDLSKHPTKIKAPWTILAQNKDDDNRKIHDVTEETANNEVEIKYNEWKQGDDKTSESSSILGTGKYVFQHVVTI